jgi:diacylglycerol kinase family enzyme
VIALIVNPSAGGGRAAKALPKVQARLRELGVIADAPVGVPTALTPIDLAVQLAGRSLTRVDADYRELLAPSSPVA